MKMSLHQFVTNFNVVRGVLIEYDPFEKKRIIPNYIPYMNYDWGFTKE